MTNPIKVVLVDDNEDYLFTMETFLKRNGFEVKTASDGEKGVELIKTSVPDVVLLDVMMETTFSGFEACKKIRKTKGLESMPIIGISAMVDELDVTLDKWPDAEYFSPDDFMSKPVDKELLLTKIDEVLQKAKKNKRKAKIKMV